MSEVVVLNVKYAPDWPHPERTQVEVHASVESVIERLDYLKVNDPFFIGYDFDTYKVRDLTKGEKT